MSEPSGVSDTCGGARSGLLVAGVTTITCDDRCKNLFDLMEPLTG